jgi:hypothetical protein
MGAAVSKGEDEKVIVAGLNEGSVTTLLRQLRLGGVERKVPYFGFSYETLRLRFRVVEAFACGGRDPRYTPLHRKMFFAPAVGVVFVVDPPDGYGTMGTDEARAEVRRLLAEESLNGVPWLVVANSQDLPPPQSPAKFALRMGLDELFEGRPPCEVMCLSVGSGQGVGEVRRWVTGAFSAPLGLADWAVGWWWSMLPVG